MKKLRIGFGVMILILFGWILYSQLVDRDNIDDIWAVFIASLTKDNIIYLIVAIVLMPVNWSLETQKWRLLIDRIEPQTIAYALKTILAGVTLGLITPQRIGEYGARAMFVDKNHRPQAFYYTFITSIGQNINNVFFGIIGLLFFIKEKETILSTGNTLLFSVLLGLFFLTIYFMLPILVERMPKEKFTFLGLSKLQDSSVRINFVELINNLFLSCARYGVYVLQLALVYKFLGVEEAFLILFCGISIQFLLQSFIPLPPYLGIILNVEIGLLIWSYYGINEMSVVAASLIIWIINLLVPSIFGLYFLQKKLLK